MLQLAVGCSVETQHAYLVFQLAYRLRLRNTNDQLEAGELSKKIQGCTEQVRYMQQQPDCARQSPVAARAGLGAQDCLSFSVCMSSLYS